MTNFLKETQKAIKNSGHSIDDVVFVGSRNGEYRLTWSEFVKMADFEYNLGYGAQHIATDLIVYFADGDHMWRGEYDGLEWWVYMEPLSFNMEDSYKTPSTIGGKDWAWHTVEDKNK
jgi:hypothetical protein